MNKGVLLVFLVTVMCFPIASAITYCNPNLPGGQRCITQTTSGVNNNSVNVNNTQFWQGYTPQTYNTTFISPLAGMYIPFNNSPQNADLNNKSLTNIFNLASYGTSILGGSYRFYTGTLDGVNEYSDFRTNNASFNLIISAPKTGGVYLNYEHGYGGMFLGGGNQNNIFTVQKNGQVGLINSSIFGWGARGNESYAQLHINDIDAGFIRESNGDVRVSNGTGVFLGNITAFAVNATIYCNGTACATLTQLLNDTQGSGSSINISGIANDTEQGYDIKLHSFSINRSDTNETTDLVGGKINMTFQTSENRIAALTGLHIWLNDLTTSQASAPAIALLTEARGSGDDGTAVQVNAKWLDGIRVDLADGSYNYALDVDGRTKILFDDVNPDIFGADNVGFQVTAVDPHSVARFNYQSAGSASSVRFQRDGTDEITTTTSGEAMLITRPNGFDGLQIGGLGEGDGAFDIYILEGSEDLKLGYSTANSKISFFSSAGDVNFGDGATTPNVNIYDLGGAIDTHITTDGVDSYFGAGTSTDSNYGFGTASPVAKIHTKVDKLLVADWQGVYMENVQDWATGFSLKNAGGSVQWNIAELESTYQQALAIQVEGTGLGLTLFPDGHVSVGSTFNPTPNSFLTVTGNASITQNLKVAQNVTAPNICYQNGSQCFKALGGSTAKGNYLLSILSNVTDSPNNATAETPIFYNQLPAYILNQTGDMVVGYYSMNVTGSGTATADIKIHINKTLVYDSGAIGFTTSGDIEIIYKLQKRAGANALSTVSITTRSASATPYTNTVRLYGMNFSQALPINITATSGGVGASSNFINGLGNSVQFIPAGGN